MKKNYVKAFLRSVTFCFTKIQYAKKKIINFLKKKRKFKIERINNLESIKQLFLCKTGLEVGGPSRIFRNKGLIPIYKVIKELDGCNFSNTTIWEGNIKNGETYHFYKNNRGTQLISEASDIAFVPDSKYEFIISSNCLEHIANPLKAIHEWIRLIKKDGLLLLVLPNKDFCFDHNRPITKFSHLLDDLRNNVQEDDLTHLNEILELHDLTMDLPAGNIEKFKSRSLKNSVNRALHHHVFNVALLEEIYNYFELEILMKYEGSVHVIIGKKSR
jgi:SAM-dependent methyltransferase